jgi:hypothetical protein
MGKEPPTAADAALQGQQNIDYAACNALVANVAFFLPNNNPDAQKNDAVQTQLQGINILFTVATINAAGATVLNFLNRTDWTATLAARKAALV